MPINKNIKDNPTYQKQLIANLVKLINEDSPKLKLLIATIQNVEYAGNVLTPKVNKLYKDLTELNFTNIAQDTTANITDIIQNSYSILSSSITGATKIAEAAINKDIFTLTNIAILSIAILTEKNGVFMLSDSNSLEELSNLDIAKGREFLQQVLSINFIGSVVNENISPYQDIINKFNNDNFFSVILSHPQELETALKGLNTYINSDKQNSLDNMNNMVCAFIKLAQQEELKEQIVLQADQDLVKDIFALEVIAQNNFIKPYESLVLKLASEKEKFQPLLSSIISHDAFIPCIENLTKYAYTPIAADDASKEEKELNKLEIQRNYDNFMSPLVEIITSPDLLTAIIPTINSKVIEELSDVLYPDVKKPDKTTLDILQVLPEAIEKNKNSIIDAINEERFKDVRAAAIEMKPPIQIDINKLNEVNLSQQNIKTILKKAEETPMQQNYISANLRILANNPDIEKVRAVIDKQLSSETLESLVNSKMGEALKNFCITGQDLKQILPKIMSKKALNILADLVESKTTLGAVSNGIKLIIETQSISLICKRVIQAAPNLMQSNKKDLPTNNVISERGK
jgi:hypothetical protein